MKTVVLLAAVLWASVLAGMSRAAAIPSPDSAVASAIADLESLPEAVRSQTRYLSLYNIPPDKRGDVALAATYLLNAVGRSRVVARPGLTADGELLRVDLAAYADFKAKNSYREIYTAWEKLAAVDPYFHIRSQIAVADEQAQPANYQQPGYQQSRQPPAKQSNIKTVTSDGGWVGLKSAAKLKQLSTSFGAVLRADWFVAEVSSTPAYYDWLGVQKTEAEFFKALGIDVNEINRLAADAAANMFQSRVTGKPRRVIMKPGPLGSVWVTKDAAVEAPDKDPFRNPLDYKEQKFKFDATEIFYRKANGLWGTVLYNANGQRQNAVPPNIATDHTAPVGHQELRPLISCIRCHEVAGGKDGLQPFADDQTVLSLPLSDDPLVEQRLGEIYDPARLAKQFVRDQEDYADAVVLATGSDVSTATNAYTATYAAHVYRPVTAEIAAAELGLPVDALCIALNPSEDPVARAIRQGQKVTRKTFESGFQDMALHAVSYRWAKYAETHPGEVRPKLPPKKSTKRRKAKASVGIGK